MDNNIATRKGDNWFPGRLTTACQSVSGAQISCPDKSPGFEFPQCAARHYRTHGGSGPVVPGRGSCRPREAVPASRGGHARSGDGLCRLRRPASVLHRSSKSGRTPVGLHRDRPRCKEFHGQPPGLERRWTTVSVRVGARWCERRAVVVEQARSVRTPTLANRRRQPGAHVIRHQMVEG
jgi:hypothetical protein